MNRQRARVRPSAVVGALPMLTHLGTSRGDGQVLLGRHSFMTHPRPIVTGLRP